jgi:plasmid maintenance system antidote protein VapI
VEASNLSAVLNGKRKITIDLAVKLGQIFQVHSSLWLLIQSKNDLLAFEEATKEPYQHLRLEDLLDKAS